MGQGHRSHVGLLLAIAIAVHGCATAVPRVEESRRPEIRKQRDIVVVHYQHAAPFLLGRPRSVGRAMALGATLALPFGLLFGPLAPSMANALQADIEKREAEAAGQELTLGIPIEDPVVRVKDRLISRLSAEGGIGPIRASATAMVSDDLQSLKQALGPVTVLDLRTTRWGLHPNQTDPKTFLAHYTVKARLIHLHEQKVLWRDEISCYTVGDRRFGAPTLEDLKADGGTLLKSTMADTAEVCVAPLLASFRGEKATRPVHGPDEPAKIVLDPATLERSEDALFGPGGLVDGSRRFEAKFQGLALTAQDLPRLRTILQRATAAPWRSEVQFRGTVDGLQFKAEVEKGRTGRSEFTFEGLRFDDEEQARAFLAPLLGRGVREVKLVDGAGGPSIKLVPSSGVPPRSEPAVATRPATALPAAAAATPPAEPDVELKRMIGTWTGTLSGPPQSGADLGIRHELTYRIFERDGVIRWEGTRRSAGRELSRGWGTVALAPDGIVLSGQRRDVQSSSPAVPVKLTLIRRGQTLEGAVLSRDNQVYTILVTRSRTGP